MIICFTWTNIFSSASRFKKPRQIYWSIDECSCFLNKNALESLVTIVSASEIDGESKKNTCVKSCKGRKRNHFSHFE